MKLILAMVSTLSVTAQAATVTCTASCMLDRNRVVTVQSKGIDQQDAVIALKNNCEQTGKNSKSSTHFLATSIAKPNAAHTVMQTEFDIQKACF